MLRTGCRHFRGIGGSGSGDTRWVRALSTRSMLRSSGRALTAPSGVSLWGIERGQSLPKSVLCHRWSGCLVSVFGDKLRHQAGTGHGHAGVCGWRSRGCRATIKALLPPRPCRRCPPPLDKTPRHSERSAESCAKRSSPPPTRHVERSQRAADPVPGCPHIVDLS